MWSMTDILIPTLNLRKYKCLAIGLCSIAITLLPLLTEAQMLQPPIAIPMPSDLAITIPSSLPNYVIIRSSDEITFSSETTASVDKINVKEGDIFHEGDTLLELDCRAQKADLDKANAQLTGTNIALKSAQKLSSYNSISEYELTQASSQNLMADAEAKKLLAIVSKCVIKAPFNGAVSNLMVHALETVKPGDPMLKILNTENLDFATQIPSSWLTWLHVGSDFTVHVNEINKDIKVKVARINPEIDSISQTVKVIGNLTSPDNALRPGMSGQATFTNTLQTPATHKSKV
jgi:membrane fusion protein (multidrug efflux system)